MSVPLGKYIFRPNDRLFEPIRQLCTLTACVNIATLALSTNGQFARLKSVTYRSKALKRDVRLPLEGPLEFAIHDEIPDAIILNITTPMKLSIGGDRSTGRNAIIDVAATVAGVAFANLYESSADDISARYGRNSEKWPGVINFARIIRNAIAHSGRVHFKNERANPVSWHGFLYSPKDEGKAIIGGEFHYGEMLLLMIAFAEELDRI